jgi:hypothetical protein
MNAHPLIEHGCDLVRIVITTQLWPVGRSHLACPLGLVSNVLEGTKGLRRGLL